MQKLLFLLPFYVIRYEKSREDIEKDPEKLQKLLDEYVTISRRLEESLLENGKEALHRYLVEVIIKIADYIFSDSEKTKKGVDRAMGGEVLELKTDKLMNRHPGREEQTIHLLKSIELKKGMKALDLGAGEGETVRIMKAFGLNVQGVDLVPRSSEVQQGDFLDLQYAADSMDLCISQCAFFVSRDQKKAVSECWRVLKKGGFLLLSDLDPGNLLEIVKETGFTILCQEDQTALWREYYLEAIWNDSFCCEDHKLLQKEYKGRKIGYTMVVGRKE